MAQPVSALDLPEDGVEDMITLDNLSEDTMLQNLHRRYEKNKIYTYTGTILISVNPFKSLPIYTSSVLQRYIGKRIGLEPPHIFAVADEAYRNLREREQNQSIIIRYTVSLLVFFFSPTPCRWSACLVVVICIYVPIQLLLALTLPMVN
jgi:hypothetical protein